MSELILKLAANGFILLIAVITWWLEYKWQDRRSRARRLGAHALLAAICIGSIAGASVTWRSHSEEHERHERISRIDQGVVELVKLARERNPNLTEQEALRIVGEEVRSLRGRTSELERELDGVKRYGSVAKLNGKGLSGRVRPGSGLKETTSLSRVLEGAYTPMEKGKEGRIQIRCDDKGIAAFRKAMEINPDFPFSHWALAICAVKARDNGWRAHAERAVTIFEHTTQIAGHHKAHEEALKGLRKLLAAQ